MYPSTKILSQHLAAKSIPHTIEEGDHQVEDDAIDITDTPIHVQCGEYGMSVVKQTEDNKLSIGQERRRYDEVIADIRDNT